MLTMYERENTTLFSCQSDQRFSYFAYVPSNYREDSQKFYPLAVVVHGTNRTAERYRDAFIDFAERNQVIILAPLFPAGITAANEVSSYKFIQYGGVHYDQILFSMIAEMKRKYRIKDNKFLLHGFSGGGHFTHRMMYLHPDKILAASIGAPGRITYIDESRPWYVGIKDFEEKFGYPFPLEQIRKIPTHMVIGDDDKETGEINNRNDPFWMEGMDDYGKNRVERLEALKKNFVKNGIDVQHDLIPEVGHEGIKVIDSVTTFFEKVLKKGIDG